MKPTRGISEFHYKLRSSPQMYYIVHSVESGQCFKSEMVHIIAARCQIYV